MSGSAKQVPVIVITGAHPKLYNHDLAPVAPEGRSWGTFSLFAMWMSDVHSVGGYTFAASLFFLGLAGWQVLLSMIVGIGSEIEVLAPLSTDRPAQMRALSDLKPWGTTGLHDAIIQSIDAVQTAKGRRALVLLSDGTDRYSKASAAEAARASRTSAGPAMDHASGRARRTRCGR